MNIILLGNPITKKNSQQLIVAKGRPIILPSAAYRRYEESCLAQMRITRTKPEHIAERINLRCVYYMETRRKVDLVNLLEATQDVLVAAGILADDESGIIARVDGSEVRYDKQNPRVEITITREEEAGE